MDPTDETTGATTDAGMDGFLPFGRLEGNRIIQILSALNCRFLGAEFSLAVRRVYETSFSIITAGSAHTAASSWCPGRTSPRSNLRENFQRMEWRVCTR